MTIDELICKIECQDVLTRLCTLLDEGKNQEAGTLFAEDTILIAPDGAQLVGEQAFAFLAARPSGIATRHIMTNVLVTPTGENTADACAYILVYRVAVENRADLPRTMPATPQAAGDWHIQFRKTPAGWRISRYSAVQVLTPPT